MKEVKASFAQRIAGIVRQFKLPAVTAVILFVPVFGALADASPPLTFEQRLEYQRRIERVRWQHRTSVAGRHRAFEEAVPDDVIRHKVATYLLQGEALARYWSRPLTGAQLQAEMDRMARSTKAPDRLGELFAALDDDPFVIAECLARPVLTDRLIRSWYAHDTRFHREVRSEAEEAVRDARGSIEALRAVGHAYAEAVWERSGEHDGDPSAKTVVAGEEPRFPLSPAEWAEVVEQLAQEFSLEGTASSKALPLAHGGALGEDAESFFVHVVLERADARLRFATVRWEKRTFDAWWAETRTGLASSESPVWAIAALDSVEGGYRSAALGGDACEPDTWAATLTPGTPDGRRDHTAVWTGTEMIVWGGRSGSTWGLDTGGRYEPATDSWTETSVGGAVPSGRARHTAVWTGTEMIVWGGCQGSGNACQTYLVAGGRYDPVADSWSATSAGAAVPSGREGHTAVWTGTEMIVWGGSYLDGSFTVLNTGGRYDPATDGWTPTPSAGVFPRSGHNAIWTASEMIVWGGWRGNSYGQEPLQNGARYDPSTNGWTATSTGANVPAARFEHTAVWTGSLMVVWGGAGGSIFGGRYDPTSDSWTPTSTGTNVPAPRRDHTAVWTGTEMIVWGGVGAGANLDTGGRYDPVTDTWTVTSAGPGLPARRQEHTAVWTGNEMVVWGGNDGESFQTGGRYDPATDTWAPITPVPMARTYHTAVWTGAEMIVWGGLGAGQWLDTGGRYDPATNSWSATGLDANVPSPRRDHTAVWTGTEMIVWGGLTEIENLFNTGGRYDPVTDGWMATSVGPNVPTERFDHTAVWTGTEMIVWGGYTADLVGGRYDPATDSWTPTSTGQNTPAWRLCHTAVWTGTEMIVWGGAECVSCEFQLDTGGLYDPAADSWTATSTGASVPAAREYHTAVWTGTEMIVWGGAYFTWDEGWVQLDTGGRYDPLTDSWTPTNTAPDVPSAREEHSAVWTGEEMVVWGGLAEDGSVLESGGRYCVCAASAAPSSVPSLVATKTENGVSFGWSAVEGATGYDAVKGTLSALRATAGDFAAATSECLGCGIAAGPVSDDDLPASGDALWYLVRPRNCAGTGTYDSGGPAQATPRDAKITASPAACPD